jgi:hypothetical protein
MRLWQQQLCPRHPITACLQLPVIHQGIAEGLDGSAHTVLTLQTDNSLHNKTWVRRNTYGS